MMELKKYSQTYNAKQLARIATQIKQLGKNLGLQQIAITDIELAKTEQRLHAWLANNFHGDMSWMSDHGSKRSRPGELVEGTIRVISASLDYLPDNTLATETVLNNKEKAFISRYALGRDYHKILRKRLQKLANEIEALIGPFGYRVFVDSAPVMEKPLAEKAGLGWIGKHSNLINKQAGSWFFLGEIYIDVPLPVDKPAEDHCGTCSSCIDVCPTKAIIRPYVVDARLCISFLTIELKDNIPEHLRPMIGNRIYGCDDCQLCCPWNRFAQYTNETDFSPRHQLDNIDLIELFKWDEQTFLNNTEGSAIRRIGHERWLRNIAVALGNMLADETVDHQTRQEAITILKSKQHHDSAMVVEHVTWALQQYQSTSR